MKAGVASASSWVGGCPSVGRPAGWSIVRKQGFVPYLVLLNFTRHFLTQKAHLLFIVSRKRFVWNHLLHDIYHSFSTFLTATQTTMSSCKTTFMSTNESTVSFISNHLHRWRQQACQQPSPWILGGKVHHRRRGNGWNRVGHAKLCSLAARMQWSFPHSRLLTIPDRQLPAMKDSV